MFSVSCWIWVDTYPTLYTRLGYTENLTKALHSDRAFKGKDWE